jgi:hypothetical protein
MKNGWSIRKSGGITGVPGGVSSIAHIVQLAKQQFAPASTGQPPISTTATGMRQANRPAQTQIVRLVGGAGTWTFGTPFNTKPSVQLSAEGAPTGTPALWFTVVQNGALFTGVVIHSTNAADVRAIHITVTGNPN